MPVMPADPQPFDPQPADTSPAPRRSLAAFWNFVDLFLLVATALVIARWVSQIFSIDEKGLYHVAFTVSIPAMLLSAAALLALWTALPLLRSARTR